MPRSEYLSFCRRLFLFLAGFYLFFSSTMARNGSCDSIQVYYDRIRYSQDNKELAFWVERALLYAKGCGDMRAFYEFKFSQSGLSFLQGDYASAFDSLAGLEKEVAVYLHQPPSWIRCGIMSSRRILPYRMRIPWEQSFMSR